MVSQHRLEELAARLEKNQTPHERWLATHMKRWCDQKDLLCHPQIAMHGYIVDFFFPQLSLAVELDGSQHDPVRDSQRDARLLKNGVQVIRFKNPTSRVELNDIFWRIYAEARYKLKKKWKPGKHQIST